MVITPPSGHAPRFQPTIGAHGFHEGMLRNLEQLLPIRSNGDGLGGAKHIGRIAQQTVQIVLQFPEDRGAIAVACGEDLLG